MTNTINSVAIPDSHRDLFEKPVYAVVTTVMPDGQPQSTVVWADMKDGYARFNTARGRQKDRNLKRNAKVTMVLIDPENAYRWIEIRGTAQVTEEGGRDQIEALSWKYKGQKYYGGFNTRTTPEQETRVVVTIHASRVRTMG
ncbi:MAG: PPOX class F420-dependent oxidoreductase [Anaerolineae bacterium]